MKQKNETILVVIHPVVIDFLGHVPFLRVVHTFIELVAMDYRHRDVKQSEVYTKEGTINVTRKKEHTRMICVVSDFIREIDAENQ